ncbi:MAG: hypothetical protein WBG95_15765 [Sulfitobacter sp.]
MKRFFEITLITLVALSLLGLTAFLSVRFYEFSTWITSGAKTLKPEIYVPLTVTVFTATLGLAVTLITQNRVRKREIEAAYRDRKIEIYLDFLKTIESLFLSQKEQFKTRTIDNDELVLKIADVRTKAVLWGSTGVLKALSKLTKLKEGNTAETMDFLDSIQREIRKDLGLSNRGLDDDFFVTLILNDPADLKKIRSETKKK